jgi:hypothetical protein
MKTKVASLLAHGAVALGFTALALAWSYPLVLHLSTHLPGRGLGDNALYLWDFWWMRTAIRTGTDFFYSPYLFAPVGADLTLHSHDALAAFAGATALRRLPVIEALNVTTLASLALNGFCAYLLAFRTTCDRGAAVVAGIVFGLSPYVAAHLNGHFDLVMVWPLALFALVAPAAIRGSMNAALLSGVVLAMTAFITYYYVVYDMAFALCVVAVSAWEWSAARKPADARRRRVFNLVVATLIVDVAILVTIVLTGGVAASLGPLRISMRDVFNPLEIFWLFLALAVWLVVAPRIRARTRDGWSWIRSATACAVMVGTFLIAALPLVWNGVRLLASGAYVTQNYYWRSAPVGADVLTLALGNPFNGLWGTSVRHLYLRLGIDAIESGAWLGIVPLALAVYALRRRWLDADVRRWTVVAGVFFAWALGSLVHVAGRNTAMMAPALVLRFVPLAANARMPGRAMVIVYLALAMLAAIGAAHWAAGLRRPTAALLMVATLVCADSLAAPFPLTEVNCPTIYNALRDRPEHGALAELPLGIGDGFGAITPLDPWTLACQMIHARPIVGGVVARLPASVLERYHADRLIAGWLRLSGERAGSTRPASLPGRDLAGRLLQASGIKFVILHRGAATPELRAYVEDVLPLTRVSDDGDRVLYVTASP